ncbi:MAG TPA: NAD(P)/FAD-dependent oxidoreductase [Candidatus Microbacterium stercoravium]|uniref:NAD(P)/FAD-dependent oxidoreductase n=1 Tax=Candidatus Microbacterium stercoravium TaxID=2838697 RepID=A0A9D2H469_9MICO|nr:NAD(P)/FAD-dependent oxidoreductase [Candidatus Microbacterium stercoravium]
MTLRVDAVIVGAGFAGIAQAIALRDAGVESFVILERADRIGGTWRDNTYPGIACDVPSHLYGLASHPWPHWSRVFAPGGEIQSYLERIVAEEGLSAHLFLGTAMADARWESGAWRISTAGAEHNDGRSPADPQRTGRIGGSGPNLPYSCPGDIVADHLVLAAGRLTEPNIPGIRGLGTFSGPLFHSSRWDHRTELAGRRVAVVGTGATAIQLVPELARRGAEVTLFQRTPAWIVPRGDHPVDAADKQRFAADPSALAAHRQGLYDAGEARFASRSGDPIAADAMRRIALEHLERQVSDPALRQALTPDYAFGCKRVLLSDDFYPAIANGSVVLEASELAEVRGSTLIAASGRRHEADVIVLATGFETTRQPYAPLVTGERGITLDAHWSKGMTAVASTLVAGFPNLFVVNGPNASLGHNSSVLLSEAQADFAAGLIAERVAAPFAFPDPVRVTDAAERASTAEIAERAAHTPWLTGGCGNWYVDDRSGALTLLWPGTVADFRARLDRVRSPHPEGVPL